MLLMKSKALLVQAIMWVDFKSMLSKINVYIMSM